MKNLPPHLVQAIVELCKRNATEYRKLGEFFGYPKCCIDEFCEGKHAGLDTVKVHKGKGFIPCEKHRKQILAGEETLEGLIKNRKTKAPFPLGFEE